MGLTQVNTSSHLGQSYHVGRNICTVYLERRSVWVIRKRWPRSEAVTPIINIYIGVGLNIVDSTH